MSKTLTLEFTTNHAPTNLAATLEHNNIAADVRILQTFPSKRYEVVVSESVDAQHVLKITNANAVLGPLLKETQNEQTKGTVL